MGLRTVVAIVATAFVPALHAADPVTYETLVRRTNALLDEVLAAVAAEPAECIDAYRIGFRGPTTLFCGAVELDRERGRELRDEITSNLAAAGFEPDVAIGKGRWHRPYGERFDARAFVQGFLPVYVAIDVRRDRVAIVHPLPVPARKAVFSPPGGLGPGDRFDPPRVLRTVRPDYPEQARIQRRDGTVFLEILVGADGRVAEARIVDVEGGRAVGFEEEALRVTRLALYAPATLNGEPVEVTGRVEISFSLWWR